MIAMSASVQSAAGRWRSVHPGEAAAFFSAVRVPWWIAGGWALDLFVGKQSRPHKDLDIGVLRRDVMTVLSALPSWAIFEAKHGQDRVDVQPMRRRTDRATDSMLL